MLVSEKYNGGCFGCPDSFGYSETELCEGRNAFDPFEVHETCTKCWDREVEE